jgi:hypothetical protein
LTQAEIAAWNSLQKTPLIGEYVDKPAAALNDFYFYTVLPLSRLPNLLTMKILSAEDFPFCEGNPINFSFNPRSALAFYLFSQGHADYPDRSLADRTSRPWLLCFRLKVETLLTNFEDGNFSLWNRRYRDWLTTCWTYHFKDDEWETLKAFEFTMSTGDIMDALQYELHFEPTCPFAQFYHLIIPKTLYRELTGTPMEDDEEWEKVSENSKVTLGLDHLAASLSSSSNSGEATSSQTLPTLNFTRHWPNDQARRALEAANLLKTPIDAVYTSMKGRSFHFTRTCQGLSMATTKVTLRPLAEALDEGKVLCTYCSAMESTHRTTRCISNGCTYQPTFLSFHCCVLCKKTSGNQHGQKCRGTDSHFNDSAN